MCDTRSNSFVDLATAGAQVEFKLWRTVHEELTRLAKGGFDTRLSRAREDLRARGDFGALRVLDRMIERVKNERAGRSVPEAYHPDLDETPPVMAELVIGD